MAGKNSYLVVRFARCAGLARLARKEENGLNL
jgi:hypothetical protein